MDKDSFDWDNWVEYICEAASVYKGSLWIICLAAVLDQVIPLPLGTKGRGAKVFDELLMNGYLVTGESQV